MRRLCAVLCMASLLCVVSVGCNKESDKMDSNSSEPKMMTSDACSHCAGVQTAKADGTCPACGMKVKG